jgi:hypothetical protein
LALEFQIRVFARSMLGDPRHPINMTGFIHGVPMAPRAWGLKPRYPPTNTLSNAVLFQHPNFIFS